MGQDLLKFVAVGNSVYVNLYNEKGRYVAVGGCKNVFIYDTVKKKGISDLNIFLSTSNFLNFWL